jgi:hypothetical protein
MQFFRKELEPIEDSDNEIEISLEELEEKVNLLKRLLERLAKHCFKYDLDAEELAYHSNLKQLLGFFGNLDKEYAPEETDEDEDDEDADEDEETDDILFSYDYDAKSIERIKILGTADFETEIQDI